MVLGMCIGVLDEKLGPTAVFQKNLSDDNTKKIVMKVMIGVMSFSTETDEHSLRGESIIPFLKEGIITFAYLFPLKDVKARGGLRQCSIIIAFDENVRKNLYENANSIGKILKSMSEEIEIKHIEKKVFPEDILVKFEQIPSTISIELSDKDKQKQYNLTLVCPQCSKSKEINLPTMTKGVHFIEHQVAKDEVCNHSFTVYLDSKFNILGYKDPEIELTDMKKMFSKLKSPYD
ncbi:MAG TPA: hypothetical protein VMX55_05380 [candidate division Zixibacteria bacterium]|nr:hypothetical protein [candidate division Zixibacteria bacterium]